MADMASSTREDGQVASRRGSRAGQPKRRSFTAAYKLKILERYEQLEDPAERGALLRREGLYHSHIEYWRAARDKGALRALSDKPAGRPPRSQAEVPRVRRFHISGYPRHRPQPLVRPGKGARGEYRAIPSAPAASPRTRRRGADHRLHRDRP